MTDQEFEHCTIQVERLEDNFTIISNQLLQDPDISMDAQAIATYILSLPKYKKDGSSWEIHPRHIWKTKNIGRDRVYKAINELCQLGYMKKVVEKRGNLDGKITYFISTLKKFLRHPGSQDSENQDPENQDYKKKQEEKGEKETNKQEAPASAPCQPPVGSVCSFRDSLLNRTKLTAPQAMKIKTQFAHLDDGAFKESIEEFLNYAKNNAVGDYMATLITALGGKKGSERWILKEKVESREEENKQLAAIALRNYDNKEIGSAVKFDVNLFNKSVVFSVGLNVHSFEYKKLDFKEAVNEFLEKIGAGVAL